ncbi:hypothetical protein [Hamadaea tsunoensis]|uniref:hypothetical protein n=1 Tax=Hamadaea tsunoensis TaxID=53368 RepID=UPI000557A715|nr:hypothetical protein [Hamadaea tsunoensis]
MIGFLHTSPVHVPTFDRLAAEVAPGTPVRHVVDESMLADARAGMAYTGKLSKAIHGLEGSTVIVCTCSTIGAHAEAADPRVIRVDRPMAARAARYPRVAVVAALASTLAPTERLLREEAARAGTAPALVEVACLDAWSLFEAGDLPAYHQAIASRVRGVAPDVDAVVLAQASMAPALDYLADLTVPVLASPRSAVEYVVRSSGAHAARTTG